MHIGILIPTLYKGGAEKIAGELSFFLPNDWKITFILFEHKIEYPYRGDVVVLNIPIRADPITIIRAVIKTKNIVKNRSIDILLSFDEISAVVASLSLNKSVITIHKSLKFADMSKSHIKRFASFIGRKIYSHSPAIVGVSKGICNELINYVGINADKVYMIYNGHRIDEIRQKSKLYINERGLPNWFYKGGFIINVGRLSHQKGQWHLIRAFKKVVSEVPNAKLLIVGRGELYNLLVNLINRLGLEENVFIFNGRFESIYPVLSKSLFVVLSSIFEGLPNIMIESFALGKPVVSTNCRYGPAEIMEKDYSYVGPTDYGYLTSPLDGAIKENQPLTQEESLLADAILFMLNKMRNKSFVNKIKNLTMKRSEDFDISKSVDEYIKLIKLVAST